MHIILDILDIVGYSAFGCGESDIYVIRQDTAYYYIMRIIESQACLKHRSFWLFGNMEGIYHENYQAQWKRRYF